MLVLSVAQADRLLADPCVRPRRRHVGSIQAGSIDSRDRSGTARLSWKKGVRGMGVLSAPGVSLTDAQKNKRRRPIR